MLQTHYRLSWQWKGRSRIKQLIKRCLGNSSSIPWTWEWKLCFNSITWLEELPSKSWLLFSYLVDTHPVCCGSKLFYLYLSSSLPSFLRLFLTSSSFPLSLLPSSLPSSIFHFTLGHGYHLSLYNIIKISMTVCPVLYISSLWLS